MLDFLKENVRLMYNAEVRAVVFLSVRKGVL